MAVTPKDYAKAYYLATRGRTKAEIAKATSGLAAVLASRGLTRILPQVLAALPDAMREADADRHVTIESARALDDAEVDAILRATGADPKETEISLRVDPDLVGGVKIRRQDGTIDATVKGNLDRLEQAFRKAK